MSNTTSVGESLHPETLTNLGRLSSLRRADESNDARWLAQVVVNQHHEDGHRDGPAFCYSAACRAADEILNGDPRNGIKRVPDWMKAPAPTVL